MTKLLPFTSHQIMRFRRWNSCIWILIAVTLWIAGGCARLRGGDSSQTIADQHAGRTRLTYRTSSDRLNMTSGAWARHMQLASYGQPSGGLLPNMTVTELRIESPHPSGHPDYALAVVGLRPSVQDEKDGFFSRLMPRFGGSEEENREPEMFDVRTLDIPKWQAEAIITQLRKNNFFRRGRVISPEAYLHVENDGVLFGKKYKSIRELDSLIMKTRTSGRPVNGRPVPNAAGWPAAMVATRPPVPSSQSNGYAGPPASGYHPNQPLPQAAGPVSHYSSPAPPYQAPSYQAPPYQAPPYQASPYQGAGFPATAYQGPAYQGPTYRGPPQQAPPQSGQSGMPSNGYPNFAPSSPNHPGGQGAPNQVRPPIQTSYGPVPAANGWH